MKIVLVLPAIARGWIIEKMARRLVDSLRTLGCDAEMADTPSPTADVNHFMIYHYVEPVGGSLNTMAVTHVDDALKIDMVRRHLTHGVRAAICMSAMTADQLGQAGISRDALTFALPAHDNLIAPRRIIIGLTSNNYSDGRKRDWLLTKLAGDLPLDNFEFRIFGSGWDEIAGQLKTAGAEVVVTPPTTDTVADYAAIQAGVPQFDFYFYPGLDEGSMGVVDALAAGVRTIVTRQGFHLDIPHAVTHGFWDYEEMLAIFRALHEELQSRVETGRALTWTRYAERHLQIWNSLLNDDRLPGPDSVNGAAAPTSSAAQNTFPVMPYRQLLADPYRRDMALRFWIPKTYRAYLDARRLAGRFKRAVVAGA